MIKNVIWSSMIDYPGVISTVIFVGTCNFDCSYCYNKNLAKEKDIDFDKDILPKLIKRKEFISHVIISGGEPTTDENFEYMIEKLYNEGFIIGIHTNGSNPDIIERNIKKIDFLGIDVKTIEEKYDEIANVKTSFENIKKTIEIVVKNKNKVEIRTTIFPKYVNKEDCIKIAKIIKALGIKEYQLQQFYSINSAENVEAYSVEKLIEIQKEANKILPTKLKTK